MTLYYGEIPTPAGVVRYVVSDKGAMAITTPGQSASAIEEVLRRRGHKLEDCLQDTEGMHGVGRELQEYLCGQRKEFTFPLDYLGTEFQQKVWQALRDIPYGETCSYGDIARAVGNPKSARAVGQANHRNPLPLVIPCHRVCGHDGGLGGFSGGLSCKSFLLELERRSKQ